MSEQELIASITTAEPVPYIVYESAMARNERTFKRLVVALIVSISLIFLSNAIWLYAWMQYDYVSDTTTIEAENGIANYIGNDGDVYNGTDYSQAADQNAPQR